LVRRTGRYSVVTSPQLVLRQPLVAVARADHYERMTAGGLLALALLWLTYTRFYFSLQPRHLTFDGPFMYVTGKPDPGCGLTRTFAWMWRGDLAHALVVYPLGPLIFLSTFGFVAYSLAVIVSGRSLRFRISPMVQRGLIVGAFVALGLNWASKLIWLGM
jgi:hypothetical protein